MLKFLRDLNSSFLEQEEDDSEVDWEVAYETTKGNFSLLVEVPWG